MTAVCVSLFKGRRMYLITLLDAGKFRSISAMEAVRAEIKCFSNMVLASCLVDEGKVLSPLAYVYPLSILSNRSARHIKREYLTSSGSLEAIASRYDFNACSRTNRRTKSNSGSSSSSSVLRRLLFPPNSPVLVHNATITRIAQADVLLRFLNATDSSCSNVPTGMRTFRR
ncbi:hypothetical protein VTN96DRAFT_10366 [Rasamsonia emersonii]